MKFICSLILLLAAYTHAYADHVLGGELRYEYISGNTYKVSITMYGECSGSTFTHLKNAEPRVSITNEKGALSTLILTEEVDKREEITNVCPAEVMNTTCKNPSGTIPGTTRFVYSAMAELPPAGNWRFIFAAEMDASGKLQSGFSNFISNVKNNTGFGFYLMLEATLNNLHSHNSSPRYTTNPTQYYCVNMPQQYNPGVQDEDGDDLEFKLVPPYDINGITTTYVAPYTPEQPFSTVTGTFNYNKLSGQMSFTPTKQEVALVVHKTEEYRNGALVGSTMRAMTFFIRACLNSAPYGNIDPASVIGGTVDGNTINVCLPAHLVEFRIPAADNNMDNINVTLNNVPATSSVGIQNNGTQNPVISFKWELLNATEKVYTFFANYNDGACPMPGKQDMAYSINVVNPIAIFHEVMSPTNCKYKQQIKFHIDGGIEPRKIVIADENNNLVARHEDNEGFIIDSFGVGNYKILAYSDNLSCSTTYNFEVTDYGVYPDPPQFTDQNLCLDAPVQPLNVQPAPGGTLRWYDMRRKPLQEVPTYTTNELNHFKWLVNQKVKTCESVYDTVDVRIHPHPDVKIQNPGGKICIGEGIYLVATGAARYEWQPAEKISIEEKGPFTTILQPETFTVTGYSEYGCTGTDTLVFDNIELCCRFTYPDAFTPNGDGINDGWHPLTYGNVDFYLLSVYNRWGERLFTSSDPKQRWDGKQHGRPCDIGTYYFRLKANCVTGQKEENAGSFILVR